MLCRAHSLWALRAVCCPKLLLFPEHDALCLRGNARSRHHLEVALMSCIDTAGARALREAFVALNAHPPTALWSTPG